VTGDSANRFKDLIVPDSHDTPAREDKAVKYRRLLDTAVPSDAPIWQDFAHDVRRYCMSMPELRDEVDDVTQEIVTAVLTNRSDVEKPWEYAVGVIKIKVAQAIRKRREARKQSGSKDDLPRDLIEEIPDSSSPEISLAVSAEELELTEKNLAECIEQAVLALPEPKRQLFVEYYGFETHDFKNREPLVQKYDTTTYNNLQVRVHRILQEILAEFDRCMELNHRSFAVIMKTETDKKLIANYVKRMVRDNWTM
jgi:RNA polymerase sigma factor (sigma-70 family)